MKMCDGCETPVTDDYYRVFSREGVLPLCPACSTLHERVNFDTTGM